MNSAIGGPQTPAQLTTDRGHELNCGGRHCRHWFQVKSPSTAKV